ncbi:protein crumbs-like isoform X2 [Gordionus sp. m RMFG-2023]|uniref:protein crumbs-like isoform X2 n=1 Tax=Gordionus sp. m RMFG-2023 TaxID=3053472 RepID=UPI0031FC4087
MIGGVPITFQQSNFFCVLMCSIYIYVSYAYMQNDKELVILSPNQKLQVGSVAYFNGSSQIILYKFLDLWSGVSFSFRTCSNKGIILRYNSSQYADSSSSKYENSLINNNDDNSKTEIKNYKLFRRKNGKNMKDRSNTKFFNKIYLELQLNKWGYINVSVILNTNWIKDINENFLLNTILPVDDNKWHSVEMRFKNTDLVITIDHVIHQSINFGTEVKPFTFDIIDNDILPFIEIGKKFIGCIQQGANIVFNSQELASKYIVWDKCLLEEKECEHCTAVNNYCMNGGKCISNSSKEYCLCNEGYQGERCELLTPTNPCNHSPCLNKGLCLFNFSFGNFSCLCTKGYEGDNCEKNINECDLESCLNGGTCADMDGSFKCTCPPPFTGSVCELYNNPCLSKPCKNGATCVLVQNQYQCQCTSLYSGVNCEVPVSQCKSISCPPNSYCVKTNGEIKCKCHNTYTGNNCDIDVNECESKIKPCQNGGQCMNQIGDYKCVCSSDWMGKNCSQNFDPCASDPCLNQGVCMSHIGNSTERKNYEYNNEKALIEQYECVCRDGYEGKNCEANIDDCLGVLCPPGKICRDRLGYFQCVCPKGYEGPNCNVNINDCEPNPCHNNALCIDQIDDFTCKCPSGYKGLLCEEDIDECEATNICKNGICSNSFGTYSCYCIPGFTGKHCEINFNECASQPCYNGGTCSDLVDKYACYCKSGFTGKDCEINIDECSSNQCLNNGNCTDLINGFKCICQPGFSGNLCEENIDECLNHPCLNGGKCIDKINRFECNCENTGYQGRLCDLDINECQTNPCHNDGICINLQNDYNCNCVDGVEGKNCEIDIDECLSQPCLNGLCHQRFINTSLNELDGSTVYKMTPIAGYDCKCNPGFNGTNCDINIDDCVSNPCLHGACIDRINDFQCACDSGYEGKLCDIEINECFNLKPCLNGGTCKDLVNNYTCKCTKDYSGRNCDIRLKGCVDHLCPEKTECRPYLKNNNEHLYECHCLPGFSGKNCDIVTLVSYFGTNYSYDSNMKMNTSQKNILTSTEQIEVGKINRNNMGSLNLIVIEKSNNTTFDTKIMTSTPNDIGITNENSSSNYSIFLSTPRRKRSLATTNEKQLTISSSFIRVPLSATSAYNGYDHNWSSEDKMENHYSLNLYFQFTTTLKTTNLLDIINEPYANENDFHKDGKLIASSFIYSSNTSSNLDKTDEELFQSSNFVDRLDWQTVIINFTKSQFIIVLENEENIIPMNIKHPISYIQFGGTEASNLMFSVKNFIGCMRDINVNENLIMPGYKDIISNKVENSCNRLKQCYETSCSGNGQCVDNWYSYSCICHRPHHGHDCKLNYDEITFNHEKNKSFLLVSKNKNQNNQSLISDLDISFFIKTREKNAFLYLVTPQSYIEEVKNMSNVTLERYLLEVSLHEGNLRVILLDVSTNISISMLSTDVKLIDESYPFVRMLKNKADLQIIISKKQFKQRYFFPTDFPFNIQNLFIGALTPSYDKLFFNSNRFNFTNFKGAIWDLRIGNDVIPLKNFTIENHIFSVQNQFLTEKYDLKDVQNLTFGSPSDDTCLSMPCLNVAKCLITWNDYSCACQQGYKGKNCEIYDLCESIICPIGTYCSLISNTSSECTELITFDGLNNQAIIYEALPKEKYNTLIELIKDSNHNLTMNLRFRTRSSDCLLLYMLNTKNKQYLAILIVEGKVVMKYDFEHNDRSARYLNSTNIVSKGEWVYLNLIFGKDFVILDSNNFLYHMNKTNQISEFVFTSNRIFLGGMDDSVDNEVWGNLILNPYKGCLKNMFIWVWNTKIILTLSKLQWINDTDITILLQPLTVTGTREGCLYKKTCKPDSCKNGGTCTDIFHAYNCTCPPGFNGSVCQNNIDDCFPAACLNGVCKDGINNYECVCSPGYTGKMCEIKIDPCKNSRCENGGKCRAINELDYTCECGGDSMFIGDLCQIPINYNCDNGNICENNGLCKNGEFFLNDDLNKVKSFNCLCSNGYEGLLCEKKHDYCKSNKCVNGTCEPNALSENYTCTCIPGYHGIYCNQDIDECLENPTLCQNNGTCHNTNGNYSCVCKKGWKGNSCAIDIDECSNGELYPCQNGGLCENLLGNFSCNCHNTGFVGRFCENDINECLDPSLNLCTENGRCINTIGSYQCECHQGYSGINCESANCSLIQCQNNGTCQINEKNNTWRCICSHNSYGLFCENLSFCLYEPCVSGICYNKPNPLYGLNYTCECDSSHGGPNCSEPYGFCLTKPCGPGTCFNKPNTEFNLNYTCQCPANFTGPNCEPLDRCEKNLCVNGDCINNFFNYTCKCLPGYSGIYCSINNNDCEPNPCNNSGKCFDEVNSFKCLCDGTGYAGPICADDVNECNQNPCKNNGTCKNLPGKYKCDCPNHLGENCEIINPCVPNPCQNGGKCKTAIANNFVISECDCIESFSGEICQNDPDAKPLVGNRRSRKVAASLIAGPIAAILLFIGLVALIAFILTAKKKRATRGAYSPSKQEVTSSRVELDHVLKPPPEERLI